MKLKKCEYCGTEFDAALSQCPLCGKAVQPGAAEPMPVMSAPYKPARSGGKFSKKKGGRFSAPPKRKEKPAPGENPYKIPKWMMVTICGVLGLAVVLGAAFALYQLSWFPKFLGPTEPASMQEEVTAPDETQEAAEEVQPAAPTEPSQPEPDTKETTDRAELSGNAEQNPAGKTALTIVWALLFAALALCIWQVVLTGLRRAAFSTGSNNKRAVMLWRHIEFLCKLDKTEPPEDLHAVALKARFSQHKLSGEELAKLQTFSEEKLETLLTNSSLPKKLFCTVILALHKPVRR